MERFTVIPREIVDDLGSNADYVVLDPSFYYRYQDELVTWCIKNDCIMDTSIIQFDRPESLSAFLLRWS